jgi:hypothetical protein
MIAKLIVHGEDRRQALEKMRVALDATRLHGIATNLDYLRQVIATEAFQNGSVWTRMLDSFRFQPNSIEVLQPGTYSSVQDYPGRVGYGISACRRPGRWTTSLSGWPTALSATTPAPPGWSLPCRGRPCVFTATPSLP